MANEQEPIVNAEQKRIFGDDGYLILRGFLKPKVVSNAIGEVEGLVDQLAGRLADEGKIQDVCEGASFETRLIEILKQDPTHSNRLFRKELHLHGLFDLFFGPQLLDLAEAVLGPEVRLYPNYSVRPKMPDDPRTLVLWHQDGGYTSGDSQDLRMLNVWTPLVPATVENGCMQFVRGSHRLGKLEHCRREHYLEIPPEVMQPLMGNVVDIELEPGDIVVFNNMLIHRGLPNLTDKIRWSMDWRYQDATQGTLRDTVGHLARSQKRPEQRVTSAEEWAGLSFR